MKSSKLSRRTVLKGLLGGSLVTLGLPPLELFMNRHGTAYADDPVVSGFPRRFGLFFWGNGNNPDRWVPQGIGADWVASEQLAPVYHLKEVITVVTGMNALIPNTVPHHAGAAGILSGRPVMNPYSDSTFAGPSIDQTIAGVIGGETRFKSLEFGSAPGSGLSYNGPNNKNPPEENPRALFERIFGGSFQLPGEDPIVDPKVGLRRSVLDAVNSQISSLKTRVGSADALRLEQHFEGIRSLEKRLAKLEEDPPDLKACALPPMPEPDYPDIEGRPQMQEKNRALCDVIALALACDQTRVFSNYFTKPLTNILFQGAGAGHHQLTHDEAGDQPECHNITMQCVQALAYQIEALKKIEEGAGTLLDNCLILGTSEVSLGKTHSLQNYPIVLAGTAGGRIKSGIHYNAVGGDNVSKLLLSICRAVGLDLGEFGESEGYVTQSLGDVEV